MTIYLYKKTHNKTGLMYLGKTSGKDPHKYKGSGDYWSDHINKHGYDVTTEILKECSTNEEVKEWGLYYSNLWDVVNARDENGKKIWANLKPEAGDGGNPGPEACRKISEIQKGRIPWNKGLSMWTNEEKKEIGIRNTLRGSQTQETIAKRVAKTTGKKRTPEQKRNASAAQKGKSLTKEHRESLKGKRPNVVPHNIDLTVYSFIHIDGTVEQCRRHELCKKYTLHQQNVAQLVKGRRKTHKGWRLVK